MSILFLKSTLFVSLINLLRIVTLTSRCTPDASLVLHLIFTASFGNSRVVDKNSSSHLNFSKYYKYNESMISSIGNLRQEHARHHYVFLNHQVAIYVVSRPISPLVFILTTFNIR